MLIMLGQQYDQLGWGVFFKSKRHAEDSARRVLEDPLIDPGRLLGTAGRLIFDHQFRQEADNLKSKWMDLRDRPIFPLRPLPFDPPTGVVDASTVRSAKLPEDLALFHSDLSGFASRWGLTGLATWDLPVPRGILEDVPFGLAARLVGPDHPTTVLPSHLDLPSDIDLRRRIREGQMRVAKDAGIDQEHPLTDTSTRGGSASQYENALRLWLIERSVAARYGKPRGFVARVLGASGRYLGCSVDRVKQLRKIYKPYLDED
jgi:hypothetical protein